MDAVEAIHKHIRISDVMAYYNFENMHHEENMIRSACKLHGGDNPTAFVADDDTGLYYCHTGGCGGGDMITLTQRIEDVSFLDAVNILAERFNVDITNLEIRERKASFLKELDAFTKAMTRYTKKEIVKAYTLPAPTREVTKFRNFMPDTLKEFGICFVDEVSLDKRSGGQYKLSNRLVVPIVQNNVQIGVSLRKTKSADFPKWSHQPISIKTRDLLFNYDNVLGKPTVVICEGPFDVMAFHEIDVPAVATYGAHITDEQYRLLIMTGADLVFAYDGDDAGREATSKAKERFRYTANIYMVPFDEGEDPESIERNQLKQKYESRVKL